MALTYLAMLSVRPDLADGLNQNLAALVGVEAKPADAGEAGGEKALAEIAALREELDKVQRDIGAMRSQVASREDRDQAIASRLAAIEAQKVTEQSSPLATASVGRGSEAPSRSADEAAPSRIAVEGPLSEPAPRQARGKERERDGERVAFGPVQVKPAAPPAAEPASPRGIQIATGPSVDALRISWMLLAERHKEILRRYEPRFVPSTAGSGPAYRLIAGPIANTAAANKVCGELRARRVTCGVSAFGGEPL